MFWTQSTAIPLFTQRLVFWKFSGMLPRNLLRCPIWARITLNLLPFPYYSHTARSQETRLDFSNNLPHNLPPLLFAWAKMVWVKMPVNKKETNLFRENDWFLLEKFTSKKWQFFKKNISTKIYNILIWSENSEQRRSMRKIPKLIS